MGRYHTIRKSVDAVRWNGDNMDEVIRFAGSSHMVRRGTSPADESLHDGTPTLEYFDLRTKSWLTVPSQQWIVRKDDGLIFFYTDEEFTDTYEPVVATRDGDGIAFPHATRAVPRPHGQVVPEHTQSGVEIPQAILDANSEKPGA